MNWGGGKIHSKNEIKKKKGIISKEKVVPWKGCELSRKSHPAGQHYQ